MESVSVQDYLQMIYRLQAVESPVPTTMLAARLHIAPASATGMIHKLHREGMAEHVPYRGVSLTEAGEREALRLLRRHRLWEVFLAEVLGLPWDEVHAEAHRLEHATSDRVADRLAAFLNEPMTDPHGQPIPSRSGQVPRRATLPLAEVAAGQRVRVVEVPDGEPERLRRLGELGLRPGSVLRAGLPTRDGERLTCYTGGETRYLDKELAGLILVTEIDERDGQKAWRK